MNFDLTEEQQQLADSVRKVLAIDCSFEKRQATVHSASGLDEALWATFAGLGLTALALPEADGGFGGGALDLMATMEACGEALVVEPLLDNVGLAGRLVARAGNAAQRAALLPGLIDGTRRLAFAGLEPGQRYALQPTTTTARREGAGWLLLGSKCVVMGAPQAHTLVVSAATPAGTRLLVVDAAAPGVVHNPSRTVDGQRCADLQFNAVHLPAEALLENDGSGNSNSNRNNDNDNDNDALPHIEEAVDFATALLCADAVGAMRYALDATLDYTKTRKQFGVPIASFQVLQHRMVEMLIMLEQARSMAILAAARVDAASASTCTAAERSRAVSAAKVKVADAARLISQESVQLHGGMGMTEELKVSHTFRRLTMAAQRFGDADHHLQRYAALG